MSKILTMFSENDIRIVTIYLIIWSIWMSIVWIVITISTKKPLKAFAIALGIFSGVIVAAILLFVAKIIISIVLISVTIFIALIFNFWEDY